MGIFLMVHYILVKTVVGGAICGLASTGLHQAFTRLIENKEN